MGKVDLSVNQLLERKDIFADLINGSLFHGIQVLNPDTMELVSNRAGFYYEEDGKKHIIERHGDVRMKSDLGVHSVFVLNETQAEVHYAMPVRDMLYAALEYVKQVKNIEKRNRESGKKLRRGEFLSGVTQEDKIVPVMTTVLYCGTDEWDGSKSLYEFMDIDENLEYIDLIKEYLPDYKLNIIDISKIENYEVFKTSLQHIFRLVRYNRNSEIEELYHYVKTHMEEIDKMDSVEILAAFVLLGENSYIERILINNNEKKKEEVSMVTALQKMKHESELLGMEKGMEKGIEALILDNIEEGKDEQQIVSKLVRRFSLQDEDALDYYKRFARY